MNVIVRNSHLDTRKEMYSNECDIIQAGICRRRMRGEYETGEAATSSAGEAAKKIRGRQKTTSNTVLRTDLGCYHLEKNGDLMKLKWQYSVGNMSGTRMPGIVDRVVWKKVPKGRVGIR